MWLSGCVVCVVVWFVWLCGLCGCVVCVVVWFVWLCGLCGCVVCVVVWFVWLGAGHLSSCFIRVKAYNAPDYLFCFVPFFWVVLVFLWNLKPNQFSPLPSATKPTTGSSTTVSPYSHPATLPLLCWFGLPQFVAVLSLLVGHSLLGSLSEWTSPGTC